MASTLPAELVEEILLRVPPDDPANLVSIALVCKAWHSIILSNRGGFLRRYRRFHGAPPLLGYICSEIREVRIVPTTTAALHPLYIRTPAVDYRSGGWWMTSALDCRHGRVLIQAKDEQFLVKELTVWDPITGDQHHLSVPSYPWMQNNYTGAVLCAKDVCDHLDCRGGPFCVVLLGMIYDDDNVGPRAWARVYSSETGAWSSLTTNNDITDLELVHLRRSIVFRDALYFSTVLRGYSRIVKYDLCMHELSVMDMPGEGGPRILVKGADGGLGVAAILHNCVYLWSRKVGINGLKEWVKYKAVDLDDTLLPNGVESRELFCMADGTNTVFIGIHGIGIFMLDLMSREVRKIGEEKDYYYQRPILTYTSFYTPKY